MEWRAGWRRCKRKRISRGERVEKQEAGCRGHRIVHAAMFMRPVRISIAAFAPACIRVYSKYQYSIFVSLDIRAGRAQRRKESEFAIRVSGRDVFCTDFVFLPHLYYAGLSSLPPTSPSSACFLTESYWALQCPPIYWIYFTQNVSHNKRYSFKLTILFIQSVSKHTRFASKFYRSVLKNKVNSYKVVSFRLMFGQDTIITIITANFKLN